VATYKENNIPCPQQVEEDEEESQAAQYQQPLQQTQRYLC